MMTRTPYYKIIVEGQDITAWVSSVQVVEDDRQADSVSITIPDPRMVFADALMEGCEIQADLGYAEKDQHALMIKAMITKVDVSYTDGGVPGVKLSGEDKSILMGLTERTKLLEQDDCRAIVRQIVQGHKFQGNKLFSSVSVRLSPDPRSWRSIRTARLTWPSCRTWRRPTTPSVSWNSTRTTKRSSTSFRSAGWSPCGVRTPWCCVTGRGRAAPCSRSRHPSTPATWIGCGT